ncbi:MAG TPA: AraC family transcriptional regulator [Polyangiaceae bacterium]|nr:AraC family transcriptional regulator [Polyangiaceae bacterium]
MAPEPSASKYGVPLTAEPWRGWPLRVGQFPTEGKLEGLEAASDTLLVWSGGTTEVTLHARRKGGTERHRFVRQGGMIDLLPRGILLEDVSWRGQESACTSVNFDAGVTERLLGVAATFEPEAPRLALTDAHVVDLVQRLQTQALAVQPWGALYTEGLSLTLASYLYARYGISGARREREDSPSALPAQRLVAFIEEHLGSDIGIATLAALAGYSPDHFARLFKQGFGLSPYQYILQRRIERAKSLLRDRTHSIAKVAMLCGFASQAHFHTTFKARTGVTPGVYRRR